MKMGNICNKNVPAAVDLSAYATQAQLSNETQNRDAAIAASNDEIRKTKDQMKEAETRLQAHIEEQYRNIEWKLDTLVDRLEGKLQQFDMKHMENARILKLQITQMQETYQEKAKTLEEQIMKTQEDHKTNLERLEKGQQQFDIKHMEKTKMLDGQISQMQENHQVAIADIKIEIRSMKTEMEKCKLQVRALSSGAGQVEILILLLCTNESYLQAAAGPIHKLKKEKKSLSHVKIKEQRLTGVLEFNPEDLKGASKVILISVPEPRGLIISEKEPSQLGACYRATKAAGLDIFLFYLNESLDKTVKGLYHSSLEKLFEAQPTIREMARNNRLISLRFKGDTTLQLNSVQSETLTNWLSH